MSAFGLKPTFTDGEGYRRWRQQWRALYRRISADIRANKQRTKDAQRAGDGHGAQKHLHMQRVMAHKAMGLLQEARDRWMRLKAMRQQIVEQMAGFPLIIRDCRTVDFHFNKGSLEYPDLPTWVCKTKGRSFYLHHMTANCPWSTREVPEGSTRGMLRFRNCDLMIDAKGEATINSSEVITKAA